MFPVEIWEEILKHSDPIDLVRFQSVCQSWRAIVPKLLEQKGIWYRKCQKDVPSGFWGLILEQKNYSVVNWWDFHAAKNHPHVWKSLLRSFMNWRKLVDLSYEIQKFEPVPAHRTMERVTCMAALSNTIAVGTSEGFVTMFDVSEKNSFKIDRAIFLLDVKLWKNGVDQLIVSTTSIDKKVAHWNVQDRLLETQSRATLISAGTRYCYSMIRNNLTRISASLTHKSQELKDRVRLDLVSWHLPDFGRPIAMCGDVNEVFLWSEANRFIKFSLNNNDPHCKISEINDPCIDTRHYQFFKPCIASCIGELGEFGFSVAGRKWKIYSGFSEFRAAVTAVLFHIGVLVVGLESGEIHIFAIENIFSLEKLNFESGSKKLMLDSSPIICISAMEDSANHYIVAATDRRVYIVKFDSL